MATTTRQTLLARQWRVEVNTGTTATPVWLRVRALTGITQTIKSNSQDDSDMDSNGWDSSTVTGRGWTLALDGLRKVDTDGTTITKDPGQEFLKAAGYTIGAAANVDVRWWRAEVTGEGHRGSASVEWAPGKGGTQDLETFAVTLNGQGSLTDVVGVATGSPA